MKIPKDLSVLSKEELIELVKELVAKMDNLTVEAERCKELKPRCGSRSCGSKSSCK